MKRNFYTRAVSLLTAFTFVLTNHFGFQTAHAETVRTESVQIKPFSAESLRLPVKFGEVVESHAGVNGNVIVVQDAHAIPDAQKNIANVIKYMQQEYGVGTVALEGASGDLDPQIFRSFPDKKLLRDVMKGYMDAGEIAGGTAAAIFDETATKYQGVEDWDVYEEGLGLYLSAMEKTAAIEGQLSALREKLNQEKETIYPRALLEVDREIEKFYENAAQLTELIKVLGAIQAPKAGSELEAVWKEVSKAKGDKTGESKDIEVRALAAKVEKVLKSPGAVKAFNSRKQEWMTGQISAEAFALNLKEFADQSGLSLEMSSDLLGMVRDQQTLKGLEGTKLFRDLEIYIREVKTQLTQRQQTDVSDSAVNAEMSAIQGLDERTNSLRILTKLSKLELSRQEWTNLSGNLVFDAFAALGLKQEDFLFHLAFYLNAEERDQIFFDNLKESTSGSRPAVIVAGGFHAEGITNRLKEAGMGYALVMPKINHIPENNSYKAQMRGEVSWKDYFEVENGRIHLYKAFVRATRDRLIGVGGDANVMMMKAWRDQIIRDLSDMGKVNRAAWYTRYMDEVVDDALKHTDADKLMSKVDNFIRGLRGLEKANQLSSEQIAALLKANMIPSAYVIPSNIEVLTEEGLKEVAAGVANARVVVFEGRRFEVSEPSDGNSIVQANRPQIITPDQLTTAEIDQYGKSFRSEARSLKEELAGLKNKAFALTEIQKDLPVDKADYRVVDPTSDTAKLIGQLGNMTPGTLSTNVVIDLRQRLVEQQNSLSPGTGTLGAILDFDDSNKLQSVINAIDSVLLNPEVSFERRGILSNLPLIGAFFENRRQATIKNIRDAIVAARKELAGYREMAAEQFDGRGASSPKAGATILIAAGILGLGLPEKINQLEVDLLKVAGVEGVVGSDSTRFRRSESRAPVIALNVVDALLEPNQLTYQDKTDTYGKKINLTKAEFDKLKNQSGYFSRASSAPFGLVSVYIDGQSAGVASRNALAGALSETYGRDWYGKTGVVESTVANVVRRVVSWNSTDTDMGSMDPWGLFGGFGGAMIGLVSIALAIVGSPLLILNGLFSLKRQGQVKAILSDIAQKRAREVAEVRSEARSFDAVKADVVAAIAGAIQQPALQEKLQAAKIISNTDLEAFLVEAIAQLKPVEVSGNSEVKTPDYLLYQSLTALRAELSSPAREFEDGRPVIDASTGLERWNVNLILDDLLNSASRPEGSYSLAAEVNRLNDLLRTRDRNQTVTKEILLKLFALFNERSKTTSIQISGDNFTVSRKAPPIFNSLDELKQNERFRDRPFIFIGGPSNIMEDYQSSIAVTRALLAQIQQSSPNAVIVVGTTMAGYGAVVQTIAKEVGVTVVSALPSSRQYWAGEADAYLSAGTDWGDNTYLKTITDAADAIFTVEGYLGTKKEFTAFRELEKKAFRIRIDMDADRQNLKEHVELALNSAVQVGDAIDTAREWGAISSVQARAEIEKKYVGFAANNPDGKLTSAQKHQQRQDALQTYGLLKEDGQLDYDTFYSEFILNASNKSKEEWLKDYEVVTTFIDEVEYRITEADLENFAKQIHDNGYWRGVKAAIDTVKVTDVSHLQLGLAPEVDTGIESFLTAEGLEKYRSRYSKPSGYKIMLSDIEPAQREAFFAKFASAKDQASIIALLATSINPAKVQLFNGNFGSWDSLEKEASRYADSAARIQTMRGNQSSAMASAFALTRVRQDLSFAQMDYATAVIWRYKGHGSGKDAWEQVYQVKTDYNSPEFDGDRYKDGPIWQAVLDRELELQGVSNPSERFLRIVLKRSTNESKFAFISSFDAIQRVINEERARLNADMALQPEFFAELARVSHDLGYWPGVKADIQNKSKAAIGRFPEFSDQERDLEAEFLSYLTEDGRKIYENRFKNPSGYKLQVKHVANVKGLFELMSIRNDLDKSDVIANPASLKGGDQVFNGNYGTWDELKSELSKFDEGTGKPGERLATMNRNQEANILMTRILSRTDTFLSGEQMSHGMAMLWRYVVGSYQGEYAYDGKDRFGKADPEGWRNGAFQVSLNYYDEQFASEREKDYEMWSSLLTTLAQLDGATPGEAFKRAILLRASNESKLAWLSTRRAIMSYVDRVSSQISQADLEKFAPDVHNNGYWAPEESKIKNPDHPLIGSHLNANGIETYLSEEGLRWWANRYNPEFMGASSLPAGVKRLGTKGYQFTGEIFKDDAAREAFYLSVGKTSQAAAKGKTAVILNENAMNFENAIRESQNYGGQAQERIGRIYGNQKGAIATAMVFSDMDITMEEMAYLTAVVWRYAGHWSGEKGYESEWQVSEDYLMGLDRAEREKDVTILMAVYKVLGKTPKANEFKVDTSVPAEQLDASFGAPIDADFENTDFQVKDKIYLKIDGKWYAGRITDIRGDEFLDGRFDADGKLSEFYVNANGKGFMVKLDRPIAGLYIPSNGLFIKEAMIAKEKSAQSQDRKILKQLEKNSLPPEVTPTAPVVRSAGTESRRSESRDFDEDIQNIVDKLVANRNARGMDALDEATKGRIKNVALAVQEMHSDQTRKDGRPYFVHQLDQTLRALNDYNVTSPVAVMINLLHDTREDQEEDYADFKINQQKLIDEFTKVDPALSAELQKEFNLIRLGVRLLTKIEKGHQVNAAEAAALNAKIPGLNLKEGDALDEAQAHQLYLMKLVNPRAFFNKESTGDLRFSEYSDEFIRDVQVGKLSDRTANLNDLLEMFKPENYQKLDKEKTDGFPAKTFNKTLNEFIRFFVYDYTAPNPLKSQDRTKFLSDMADVLQQYARINVDDPGTVENPSPNRHMGPLVDSAKNAQERLRAYYDKENFYIRNAKAIAREMLKKMNSRDDERLRWDALELIVKAPSSYELQDLVDEWDEIVAETDSALQGAASGSADAAELTSKLERYKGIRQIFTDLGISRSESRGLDQGRISEYVQLFSDVDMQSVRIQLDADGYGFTADKFKGATTLREAVQSNSDRDVEIPILIFGVARVKAKSLGVTLNPDAFPNQASVQTEIAGGTKTYAEIFDARVIQPLRSASTEQRRSESRLSDEIRALPNSKMVLPVNINDIVKPGKVAAISLEDGVRLNAVTQNKDAQYTVAGVEVVIGGVTIGIKNTGGEVLLDLQDLLRKSHQSDYDRGNVAVTVYYRPESQTTTPDAVPVTTAALARAAEEVAPVVIKVFEGEVSLSDGTKQVMTYFEVSGEAEKEAIDALQNALINAAEDKNITVELQGVGTVEQRSAFLNALAGAFARANANQASNESIVFGVALSPNQIASETSAFADKIVKVLNDSGLSGRVAIDMGSDSALVAVLRSRLKATEFATSSLGSEVKDSDSAIPTAVEKGASLANNVVGNLMQFIIDTDGVSVDAVTMEMAQWLQIALTVRAAQLSSAYKNNPRGLRDQLMKSLILDQLELPADVQTKVKDLLDIDANGRFVIRATALSAIITAIAAKQAVDIAA